MMREGTPKNHNSTIPTSWMYKVVKMIGAKQRNCTSWSSYKLVITLAGTPSEKLKRKHSELLNFH